MNAELKNSAESILSKLGITAEQALNIYYNQIVLNNGLPFDIKLPKEQDYIYSDEIMSSLLEDEEEFKKGDYKLFNSCEEAFEDLLNEV